MSWITSGYSSLKDGALCHYNPRGQLHCTTGPAIEADNEQEWWINGQLHRANGPAIERADGAHEWWLYGRYYPSAQAWNASP